MNNNQNEYSRDLSDFKFISDNHIRYENENEVIANNKGALRGIRIQTQDYKTFIVSIYLLNGNHPIWGDNIQMAPKQMKIEEEKESLLKLVGFGLDEMGSAFSDYGISLFYKKEKVFQVTLHLIDRNVDILYMGSDEQLADDQETKSLNDFVYFTSFTKNWNSVDSNTKWEIAGKSDELNNKGARFYRDGNKSEAISYFKKALAVMPNNDDALKNLKICYNEIGDYNNAMEMEMRLDFL